MAASIHILPADLASQIAAGEVVERPASIVKELIENALDAGAKRITVSIQGGGLTEISVTDDGSGMAADDAEVCLSRHATSKLRALSDLDEILSYGFRGEALPSIASVARLNITTRSEASDAAVVLSAEGTTEPETRPTGAPVGTTVVVRDLFFNVPARRKFLKSSNTESGHITEVVAQAALSRPDVSFQLLREGRSVRHFPSCQGRAERTSQVLDGEELIPCHGQRGPLTIEAYLSRPERARQGAGGLRLLVNGRTIRNRALAATIAHSYGSVLERGRYPRGVVYIDLPGRLVDVNVHPQKVEVRFAEPRAVSDALYSVTGRKLAQALSQAPGQNPSQQSASRSAITQDSSAQNSSTARVAEHRSPATASEGSPPKQPTEQQPSARDSSSSVPGPWSQQSGARVLRDGAPPPSGARYAPVPQPSKAPALAKNGHALAHGHLSPDYSKSAPSHRETPAEMSSGPSAVPLALFETTSSESSTTDAVKSGGTWKNLRFLSQAKQTYLICEGDDGLYVLDQHAACERVIFSKLSQSYRQRAVPTQAVLFPTVVDITPEEAEVLETRQEEIERLGLDVRVRSTDQASIHGVPKLLSGKSPERLLHDLLRELRRNGERSFSDAVDKVLATMACHAAVRAGDTLSATEAQALLTQLDSAEFAGYCPHGRPIVTFSSWLELERKVGRR